MPTKDLFEELEKLEELEETTTAVEPRLLPGPAAGVDEACLARVEKVLDATELAIAAVEATEVEETGGRRLPRALGRAAGTLKLSVVIPVYNERDTIQEIVRRVQAVGLHEEILIVDDFSTDGTRDILLELEQQADVRVLLHGYNRGKGAALRTAFQRVKGDVVLVQDADLEYDPRDYDRLLAPLRDGQADVVYGSRFLADPHQDGSRVHRFGNRLLTWFSNLTTGQRLTDMETCYKVFRRRVLHTIELKQERFGFEPEVTAKVSRLGCRIVEVPIRYDRRGYAAGKKIGWKDGVNAVWCILRYAWAD